MRNRSKHLTDDELLLAADGEKEKCAHRLRSHLATCVCCRTRAAQLLDLLTEVAQVEKNNIGPRLPSIDGPRAVLRSRLEELSTGKRRLFPSFSVHTLGLGALAAVILFACVFLLRHSPPARENPTLLSFDGGVLPNQAITPGAARQVSVAEICSMPHEEVVKTVSPSERQRVFAEYGIPIANSGEYEVDYLITPGLGGEDNIRNLWPEPYNASRWNARVKDALEERLHEMVCSQQIDLSAAQQAISRNWIAAYVKYVPPAAAKS